MILPYAFTDAVRGVDQGDYLTFWQLGPQIVAAHPRGVELATAAKLVAGWAELCDKVVEEGPERNLVCDESFRWCFVGAQAKKALADVKAALAELRPLQLSLPEGQDPAENLEWAKHFVDAMAPVVEALDGVRTPAWRRLWADEERATPPIDPKSIPTIEPDEQDGLKLIEDPPRAYLELHERGVVTQRIEVDAGRREARHLTLKHFSVPTTNGPGWDQFEAGAADREIALYDWIDVELEALKKAAEPKSFSMPPMQCSFCQKGQHEVRKLIAGPACFICNECVALCGEIIASESTGSAE